MKRVEAVIVVEGKMDRDLIGSFLDCDIVTTNGSAVSRETIDLIRELKKTRDVIVLTDPDAPGKRIRDILNNEIPGLLNAFVPKEKSIKGKKVGVAECDKKTIMESLSHLIRYEPRPSGTLSASDMADLGLVGGKDSATLRKRVGLKFHIGEGNAKTFLRRANMLGLTKEDLEGAIKGD